MNEVRGQSCKKRTIWQTRLNSPSINFFFRTQLTFKKGDLITVTQKEEGGWWEGTSQESGKTGWFPTNYVKEVAGPPSGQPSGLNVSGFGAGEDEGSSSQHQQTQPGDISQARLKVFLCIKSLTQSRLRIANNPNYQSRDLVNCKAPWLKSNFMIIYIILGGIFDFFCC